MPYPAEKSKNHKLVHMLFRYSYRSQRDPKWRVFLPPHLQHSLGAILSKIHQYCFMERLLSLSHILPLLPDSSIQETQASLHFLTLRITITPSALFPLNPRDIHKDDTERGRKTYPLPVTLPVLCVLLSQPGQEYKGPLRVYFLASISNTWGAYFHLRKSPIPPNNN